VAGTLHGKQNKMKKLVETNSSKANVLGVILFLFFVSCVGLGCFALLCVCVRGGVEVYVCRF
jgi:hypothetical protein